MAEDKIKPFIELNLIVDRHNYPNFIKCIKGIKVLMANGKPIPAILAEELYDCIYEKEYYISIQLKQKINRLTKQAITFFDKQDEYNFNETYKYYTNQYDDYEGPFSEFKSNGAQKKKRFNGRYSLEEFVRRALSHYFNLYHVYHKFEPKPTHQRDAIIRFFYEQLIGYIKKLPKDPLKSKKDEKYKKKIIAVYLTHLVNPIEKINKMSKITCPELFKISENSFKKNSPTL